MINTNAIKAAFEPLRIIAFGGIGANYVAIATAGGITETIHPIRVAYIVNGTDVAVNITTNLSQDEIWLPGNSTFTLDVGSNRIGTANNFQLPQHMTFYVKDDGVAPTSGKVAVTCVYGATN